MSRSTTTTVKEGWIKRDAVTGQFIAVGTGERTYKSSKKTETTVKEASGRRSAALKRLANR